MQTPFLTASWSSTTKTLNAISLQELLLPAPPCSLAMPVKDLEPNASYILSRLPDFMS